MHVCSFTVVNRSWCKTAVEILWRNIWKFGSLTLTKILNTLFICLPDESKKLLHKKNILDSKLPLFNYISF